MGAVPGGGAERGGATTAGQAAPLSSSSNAAAAGAATPAACSGPGATATEEAAAGHTAKGCSEATPSASNSGGGGAAVEAGGSEHSAGGAGTCACAPACYVIVHSVSKRHNIGTLARSATAFGVAEMCLVGSRQFNAFGSHGAARHVAFRHFASLEDCCRYLKQDKGCQVVGVEIMDGARAVQEHPFCGPTAFMLGNEGAGLSEKQVRLCDAFVYIPQHGPGTASLNVTVAASIVLHQFAVWAAYPEAPRAGHKFCVADVPQRTTQRGVAATAEDIEAEKAARKARAACDWLDEAAAGASDSGMLDGLLD